MATRSTRWKTRWNLKQASKLVDRVGETLLYTKMLQQGRSEQVNEILPVIDALLWEVKVQIKTLRSLL